MADEQAELPAQTETVHRHERPEDWGWHAELGGLGRAVWWLIAGGLLLMLIGNHEGHIEDVWLIGIVASIVTGLLMDWHRRRNAWRGE